METSNALQVKGKWVFLYIQYRQNAHFSVKTNKPAGGWTVETMTYGQCDAKLQLSSELQSINAPWQVPK